MITIRTHTTCQNHTKEVSVIPEAQLGVHNRYGGGERWRGTYMLSKIEDVRRSSIAMHTQNVLVILEGCGAVHTKNDKGVGVLTYWTTPHKGQGHASEFVIKRVSFIWGVNTSMSDQFKIDLQKVGLLLDVGLADQLKLINSNGLSVYQQYVINRECLSTRDYQ